MPALASLPGLCGAASDLRFDQMRSLGFTRFACSTRVIDLRESGIMVNISAQLGEGCEGYAR